VCDATEYIVTNGPAGPGRIVTSHMVLAGTDIVAMDALGASLLNLKPEEVVMIRKAEELGLGRASLGHRIVARITD
jgi:uncharacterized protein (DUF362 family)